MADSIPTNEDDLNTQTSITNDLELKMVDCRNQYQKLQLHVGFAWPNDDAKMKVFGDNLYAEARIKILEELNFVWIAGKIVSKTIIQY